MNWFRPSSEVKSPDELFGWNKPSGFLDGLVKIIVKGRSNVQILGERRSGKSSILNCISHEIRKDISKTKLIPVIVNFNSHHDTINSDNGYNLFSACVLNELVKIDELKPRDSIKIANAIIDKANDVGGYLNNLSTLSKQKTKSFFKNLIFDIAEKGYSILLLIDEYEAMFLGTFQGQKGSLYGIRNLITQEELPNHQVFQCCITGTRRWSDYYNDIGSDDFNFINDTQFISGLDLQETKELILYGFDQSNKEIKNKDINRIFKLSGGWPFYIKSICNSYILLGGIDVTHLLEKLYSHFHSIWQRLNNKQQLLLKGEPCSRSSIDYLENLNLLETRKRLFSNKIKPKGPKGQLWCNFIKTQEVVGPSIVNNSDSEKNSRVAQLKQVAEITNITVSEISDVLEGKELDVIFHLALSPSYWKYAGRLYNPCYKRHTFSDFIVALYIIVFESTARHTFYVRNRNNFSTLENVVNAIEYPQKDMRIFKHWTKNTFIFNHKCLEVDALKDEIINNCDGFSPTMTQHPINMAALPPQFNRFPDPDSCPDIFHIIDILRHKWAEGHDTRSKNFQVRRFMPAQAQDKYLGHRNNPENIDWYKMQLGILKDLNKELVSILNWANEQ